MVWGRLACMKFPRKLPERYLAPEERLSEILFGLIMVLSIVSATKIGLAEGETSIHTMIIAALGCNIAWGIVDGVMFVLEGIFARARYADLIMKLKSNDRNSAFSALKREIGETADLILDKAGKEQVYSEVMRSASHLQPEKPRVSKDDVVGAVACFLLVFVSTFPVLIPFFFMRNLGLATRISNLIAIVMLFYLGYEQAKYTNQNRLQLGLVMVILGCAIVVVTILLGG